MPEEIRVNLPKEKNIVRFSSEEYAIHDVASYIRKVNQYIGACKNQGCIFVYRGEPQDYDRPCRPGIFRKGMLDGNLFFERSLFDAMRQNYLTGDKRYLDNAIDAQHGEFPSRLLDVTYNCLTALYFAVTPYYKKDENSLDEVDGMVYLFFIDQIFSPSAENTNDNYDAVIKRDRSWYADRIIFEKNHKFIDHIKLNNRIIAQQGAFILFQGNAAEELPAYMTYGIKIPSSAKPLIRKELRQLFGIHTGSVYPEINHLVEEISEKGRKLYTEAFNCENELKLAVANLEKELDYYFDYVIHQKETGNVYHSLILVEDVVKSYQDGLIDFLESYLNPDLAEDMRTCMTQESLKKLVTRYNELIRGFDSQLDYYGIFGFSADQLCISVEFERTKENEFDRDENKTLKPMV